jgi:hypothetical protein
MTRDEVTEPDPPRTLAAAQWALARIRPRQQAPLGEACVLPAIDGWYAEIAEIDRGHHHEALYMAEQERECAKEIAARIRAGVSVEGEEDCGKDRDTGAAADVDAGS